MNQNSILMLFNIPGNIKEEDLFELFSVAGPINSVHFARSGRTAFINFDYEDAVVTAKEIFQDVKFYGRPIRMFDKLDIETFHLKQEDELNFKRKHDNEQDNDVEPSPKRRREYHNSNNRSSYRKSDDSRDHRYQFQHQTPPLMNNYFNPGMFHSQAYNGYDNHMHGNRAHNFECATGSAYESSQTMPEIPSEVSAHVSNFDNSHSNRVSTDNFDNPYKEFTNRRRYNYNESNEDFRSKNPERQSSVHKNRNSYEKRYNYVRPYENNGKPNINSQHPQYSEKEDFSSRHNAPTHQYRKNKHHNHSRSRYGR